MKPYYEDEWVKLYHGDWRELIDPDLRADLILTDPPFRFYLIALFRRFSNICFSR